MDQLQQLRDKIRQHMFIMLLGENVVLIGFWAATVKFTSISPFVIAPVSFVLATIISIFVVLKSSNYVIEPVQALWQSILNLSPTDHGIVAPDVERLRLGKELVKNLTAQLQQITQVAEKAAVVSQVQVTDITHNFVAQNIPLPLLILDSAENITFANDSFAQYIGIAAEDLLGKNVYMVLDMSFRNEDTFDAWLKNAKINSATASNVWERVRLTVRDNHPTLLFDLAAYYNKDNHQKLETMLVFFDHTKTYSQDEQAVSFIALSVHELRTPLTLLRGYIEVFEEELEGKVDADLLDFMHKMSATAQQLMAFVNNILNVARVDDDQLQLKLQEENWGDVLKTALDTLSLRAGVRGIQLQYSLAPNLPTVGVDRISIFEVINNLVDNAIKYSGESKVIKVDAHLTREGLVETTIQDFGGGIPGNVISNLFTKFYRDHRNRAQIGGTGLGLYLSKAIVTAHGGSIWVRSKVNEGSVFGFTLHPYAEMSDELKNGTDSEIVRSAHGWIKNHSLYRR